MTRDEILQEACSTISEGAGGLALSPEARAWVEGRFERTSTRLAERPDHLVDRVRGPVREKLLVIGAHCQQPMESISKTEVVAGYRFAGELLGDTNLC
jgi:hypothetical protein